MSRRSLVAALFVVGPIGGDRCRPACAPISAGWPARRRCSRRTPHQPRASPRCRPCLPCCCRWRWSAARRALETVRHGGGRVPARTCRRHRRRLRAGGAADRHRRRLVHPLPRMSATSFLLAPVMVVAVNAVMAMPFVVRAIRPAHDAAAERHDRLCRSLGIAGWNRLRLIDWPSLRRPLAHRLRLRHGAVARRSRRHRAVRQRRGADAALSAAGAHGQLPDGGCRRAGAAARRCSASD